MACKSIGHNKKIQFETLYGQHVKRILAFSKLQFSFTNSQKKSYLWP